MRCSLSVLGLVLLVSCATVPKQNPKAEIERVLAQRQALKAQFLEPDKTHPKKRPDYLQYVPEIKRLDVSKCPSDFRQPWFDYVVALEQAHAHDHDADWESVGKLVAAAAAVHSGGAALLAMPGLASPTGKARTRRELEQRLEDAWFKLDRACLNYGVRADR